MDRKAFFDSVRSSGIFGKSLSAEQVAGTEAIIDAAIRYRVTSPHHVAHILAHVTHETGGYMLPIKETVYASHKDKNPSDQTVINRLENAFRKGQLPWVKTPYWRDGWFGRGQIQITHEDNYRKLGNAIGVDLVSDKNRALDLHNSASIAVVGMTKGLFTGKKLSDYNFPAALDASQNNHPRRIVNGPDGTDKTISNFHRKFYEALVEAGYTVDDKPTVIPTQPEPPAPSVPQRSRSVIIAEIEALLAELKTVGE